MDQGGLERSFVVKALGVWSDSGYLLCLRPPSLVAVGLACNEEGHGLDQGAPYYARSASAAPFQLASAAHTLMAKKMYEPGELDSCGKMIDIARPRLGIEPATCPMYNTC